MGTQETTEIWMIPDYNTEFYPCHLATIHKKHGRYYTNGGRFGYKVTGESKLFNVEIEKIFDVLLGTHTKEQLGKVNIAVMQ